MDDCLMLPYNVHKPYRFEAARGPVADLLARASSLPAC